MSSLKETSYTIEINTNSSQFKTLYIPCTSSQYTSLKRRHHTLQVIGFEKHTTPIFQWLQLAGSNQRINKAHRSTAVLDNEEEGEKYAQHSLRKFLRTRPPEIMPAINDFFSNNK
ncbi:hypothetical protein MRB53_017079 [Persea americana]|uniref:Uncharacterized protein n=1 Tax=Persea americana TaxID=3435 RepID=A0ACC2M420_PERAE|nr:hypothetical protein MRB53_017079 [Persea americana]